MQSNLAAGSSGMQETGYRSPSEQKHLATDTDHGST